LPSAVRTETDRLAERLEQFKIRVIKFVRTLPTDPASQGIAFQLGRSGPGISANHRSARRSRSRAEFISRLAVVLDEADETEHWLSAIRGTGIASGAELEWLLEESRQLRAIFAASVATARRNRDRAGYSQGTSGRGRKSSDR
jgi:four helix bundle protein